MLKGIELNFIPMERDLGITGLVQSRDYLKKKNHIIYQENNR